MRLRFNASPATPSRSRSPLVGSGIDPIVPLLEKFEEVSPKAPGEVSMLPGSYFNALILEDPYVYVDASEPDTST